MPLCELRYKSEALDKHTSATVILPAIESIGPYHVMFLLHGLSDDHTAWTRKTSIERYVSEFPVIVVMPDGGRGWYTDAIHGYAYHKAIAHELPEIVAKFFPTKPRWCATGLSMGGYGAVKLALTRPDLFVSAVSHSGAVGFGNKPDYLNEANLGGEFLQILGKDSVGGINDLYAQAASLAPSQRPKLRLDCGIQDFLLEDNRLFSAHLDKIGYPHEYEEFEGDHNWPYWDLHVREAIAFHAKNLGIE